MSLISLVGTGGFHDAAGNPLAFGKLEVTLQQDIVLGSAQICAGRVSSYPLDANGNVASGSIQSPADYTFRAYTSQGLLAWTGLVSV